MPIKQIKIKVRPGWEGNNFMWPGHAVGLAGQRELYDDLKSGGAVMIAENYALRLIKTGYFVEVKTTLKPNKIEGEK